MLDDGAERAGAGLRRHRWVARRDARHVRRPSGRLPARHAALLGELIGASAVPTSGPLPGAYPKSLLPELELSVARGELSLRGVNPTTIEVDDDLLLNVNTPTDLVVAASRAFDDAIVDRPVLTPDEIAFSELASDFWSTALWAAGKLRKGEVFVAVDSVNGAMKRSLVTLMSWHALSVDPEAPVRDDGPGSRTLGRCGRALSARACVRALRPSRRRRARCGRRSTSSRVSRRRPRGGSASTPRSTMRSCAGGVADSSAIRGAGLPSGREARTVLAIAARCSACRWVRR